MENTITYGEILYSLLTLCSLVGVHTFVGYLLIELVLVAERCLTGDSFKEEASILAAILWPISLPLLVCMMLWVNWRSLTIVFKGLLNLIRKGK